MAAALYVIERCNKEMDKQDVRVDEYLVQIEVLGKLKSNIKIEHDNKYGLYKAMKDTALATLLNDKELNNAR
jgi:hypothetical protein